MKPAILFLALLLVGCYPVNVVSIPKPNIYIIRTERVHTVMSGEVWILDYTVNGEFQSPMFDSLEALREYREYLGTIGNVYQKEAQ
ncbi:MAG: hypothetical protein LBP76_02680 [Treponema sp.]|jgi:hypothetical protein|nr:hypothetical protein [Treponema sp.]